MTAGLARRKERTEQRRERILDIALECFLARGYAATSMSEMAARLGGSKCTLYRHFKSKDEVFEATVHRQCLAMQPSNAIVARGRGEPRVLLIRFGRASLEYLLSPDVLATRRLALAEAERFPQLGRAFFDAGPRLLIAGIEDYFGELMARGSLRRGDRFMAARHFMDLTVFGVYQRCLMGVSDDPTPEQTDNHLQLAVDTFLRAYAP
jgi:TetR/AcrR family transcriptional repressor of mexJK operon